ncbi:MAG: helix-turn-helix domain-containing protein [bacterium]
MNSLSSFLNVKEVSLYLGIKSSTLYTMVEQRAIPHYRLNRQIRFRKADIDLWMQERKEEVIDTKVESNKIFRSIEKKSDLDLDRIMKKAVEQSKKKGYNFPQEKPGGIEGLGKEVDDGII